MSVLGLNLGYMVKNNPLPSGIPSGTPSGKGLYLTVYTSSCPNTDTVCKDLTNFYIRNFDYKHVVAAVVDAYSQFSNIFQSFHKYQQTTVTAHSEETTPGVDQTELHSTNISLTDLHNQFHEWPGKNSFCLNCHSKGFW